MSHTLLITAYNPAFSTEFKSWIKKNINPSMINPQDEEASYFLDYIIEEIVLISEQDNSLLKELKAQNVEYVEF